MYRIRLPSGDERIFATIQELADAVRTGAVERASQIFHRRTGRWVPLESHPYFDYASGAGTDDDAPASLTAFEGETRFDDLPEPPPAPPSPAPPSDPGHEPPPAEPVSAEESEYRSDVAPEPAAPAPAPPAHAPIVPTPMQRPPVPPPPPRAEPRTPPPAPPPLPEWVERPPPRRTPVLRLVLIVLLLAAIVAIPLGLKWRAGQRTGLAATADTAAGAFYRPAPPPSTLLRPDEPAGDTASGPSVPAPDRPLVDPTVPAAAGELIARRRQAFDAIRAQLAREFAATGTGSIFTARTFRGPDAARSARRSVAAGFNVIGQHRRREVMTEQAYEDTARFQRTRAGWGADDIGAWEDRPVEREPFQDADLAEGLLADADSLLGVLTAAQWTVDADTIRFGEPARAAAFNAVRRRLELRAGTDTDSVESPTLFLVRRAADPSVLPAAAP